MFDVQACNTGIDFIWTLVSGSPCKSASHTDTAFPLMKRCHAFLSCELRGYLSHSCLQASQLCLHCCLPLFQQYRCCIHLPGAMPFYCSYFILGSICSACSQFGIIVSWWTIPEFISGDFQCRRIDNFAVVGHRSRLPLFVVGL